jgi:immunity protein, SdpI family
MNTRIYYLLGTLLIAAVLGATAIAYPHLPNIIPVHWDAHGNVNGWGAKWTLFADPAIMVGLLLMFTVLPWLSPKHFEVDSFRSTYLYIMVMILALVAYAHALLLAAGLSVAIDMTRAVEGGICLLIALLGNVLGKVRRNFYVGVRTPWTIANEQVWNATHRLAARTLFAGGLAGLVAVILRASFWAPIVMILAGALIPVIYSLIFYKQLERRGAL